MFIKPFVFRTDTGAHRQANWLEFFYLAFVICVSRLSHQLIDHPSLYSIAAYVGLFIPVWWIWNQFTWYASQFDNGDGLFRSFMIGAVGGALLLVYGIHEVSHGHSEVLV